MTQTQMDATERTVIAFLRNHPGPFRTYANPMRKDGVFIGQDRPLIPYGKGLHGQDLFPAVPRNAVVFPVQVPFEVAERALQRLQGVQQ